MVPYIGRLRKKYKTMMLHQIVWNLLFIKDGVLYNKKGIEARTVVPWKAKDIVLELGHSIPWAGHLGRQKMSAQISRLFFFFCQI